MQSTIYSSNTAYVVKLFRSQTSFLYYFLFLYNFKVLYHSKSIGRKNKIGLLFIKSKAIFMHIYCFSSSFRMGCPARARAVVWGLPGFSPMELLPSRALVPKERFLDADWSFGSSLCHMIKITKIAHSLENHSPFRQKQTFCIIIKVFCW